jgi:uncharacterized protein YcaQ
MDAKADRKQNTLTVHNLHFEPVQLSEPMIEKFIDSLKAFAKFNQCHEIVINKSNNKRYVKAIKAGLR